MDEDGRDGPRPSPSRTDTPTTFFSLIGQGVSAPAGSGAPSPLIGTPFWQHGGAAAADQSSDAHALLGTPGTITLPALSSPRDVATTPSPGLAACSAGGNAGLLTETTPARDSPAVGAGAAPDPAVFGTAMAFRSPALTPTMVPAVANPLPAASSTAAVTNFGALPSALAGLPGGSALFGAAFRPGQFGGQSSADPAAAANFMAQVQQCINRGDLMGAYHLFLQGSQAVIGAPQDSALLALGYVARSSQSGRTPEMNDASYCQFEPSIRRTVLSIVCQAVVAAVLRR